MIPIFNRLNRISHIVSFLKNTLILDQSSIHHVCCIYLSCNLVFFQMLYKTIQITKRSFNNVLTQTSRYNIINLFFTKMPSFLIQPSQALQKPIFCSMIRTIFTWCPFASAPFLNCSHKICEFPFFLGELEIINIFFISFSPRFFNSNNFRFPPIKYSREILLSNYLSSPVYLY